MKIFVLILAFTFSAIFANAQTSDKDFNETLESLTKSAKKYNADFQKEIKDYIKSFEKQKPNKSKKIKIGLGMDMLLELNKGFEFKVSFYDKILVKRSFKKKDEFVIFLKYISK